MSTLFLLSFLRAGLRRSKNSKSLRQFTRALDVSMMIIDYNSFIFLTTLWTFSIKMCNPSMYYLIRDHTQIWTWAIIPVPRLTNINLSSSHALIHLSLFPLKLILYHRVLIQWHTLWRVVSSLLRFSN